jgi:hypothetical protein
MMITGGALTRAACAGAARTMPKATAPTKASKQGSINFITAAGNLGWGRRVNLKRNLYTKEQSLSERTAKILSAKITGISVISE